MQLPQEVLVIPEKYFYICFFGSSCAKYHLVCVSGFSNTGMQGISADSWIVNIWNDYNDDDDYDDDD